MIAYYLVFALEFTGGSNSPAPRSTRVRADRMTSVQKKLSARLLM